MALIESNMMALGTIAPAFNLQDTVSDKLISLSELKSDVATVIVFIYNHCPFVLHINSKLVAVANEYQSKGVQVIAISSNDVSTHPQDGPKFMKEVAEKEGYSFPYLFDETQAIAKAYGAECTPDFFMFDSNLKCVYRGRFDDSRPNMTASTGRDLTNSLDKMLAHEEINTDQKPSIGCNIKWKHIHTK